MTPTPDTPPTETTPASPWWDVVGAWRAGYYAALADVAARLVEIDEAWRPTGRLRHEDKVARRIAEMEIYAARLRAELDRAARRGPAVPWPPVAVPGDRLRDAA